MHLFSDHKIWFSKKMFLLDYLLGISHKQLPV